MIEKLVAYFADNYNDLFDKMIECDHGLDGRLNPYHGEGSVWVHTEMVLEAVQDKNDLDVLVERPHLIIAIIGIDDVVNHSMLVKRSIYRRDRKQRSDLGGESEPPSTGVCVEMARSSGVATSEQPTLLRIEHYKHAFAYDPVRTGFSPKFISPQHELGVTVRSKDRAVAQQLAPHFFVVIDTTVHHEHD